jgi:hypothetical protein
MDNTAGTFIRSESLNNSKAFSIESNSTIMDILSNRIYKNKYLAFMREIMCNAYDAHLEKAINDIPITVKIDEIHIQIIDQGYGLHEDDIYNLYTSYGTSTKKNQNFIGNMGIGSKSPFAYTDSFMVESNFDGVRKSYYVFKDSNNIPYCNKVSEIPTDSTGLTITIPFKEDDLINFNCEKAFEYANSIGFWFDVKPQITYHYVDDKYAFNRFKQIQHFYKNKNHKQFFIFENESFSSYLVQDFEINNLFVYSGLIDHHYDLKYGSKFLLKCRNVLYASNKNQIFNEIPCEIFKFFISKLNCRHFSIIIEPKDSTVVSYDPGREYASIPEKLAVSITDDLIKYVHNQRDFYLDMKISEIPDSEVKAHQNILQLYHRERIFNKNKINIDLLKSDEKIKHTQETIDFLEDCVITSKRPRLYGHSFLIKNDVKFLTAKPHNKVDFTLANYKSFLNAIKKDKQSPLNLQKILEGGTAYSLDCEKFQDSIEDTFYSILNHPGFKRTKLFFLTYQLGDFVSDVSNIIFSLANKIHNDDRSQNPPIMSSVSILLIPEIYTESEFFEEAFLPIFKNKDAFKSFEIISTKSQKFEEIEEDIPKVKKVKTQKKSYQCATFSGEYGIDEVLNNIRNYPEFKKSVYEKVSSEKDRLIILKNFTHHKSNIANKNSLFKQFVTYYDNFINRYNSLIRNNKRDNQSVNSNLIDSCIIGLSEKSSSDDTIEYIKKNSSFKEYLILECNDNSNFYKKLYDEEIFDFFTKSYEQYQEMVSISSVDIYYNDTIKDLNYYKLIYNILHNPSAETFKLYKDEEFTNLSFLKDYFEAFNYIISDSFSQVKKSVILNCTFIYILGSNGILKSRYIDQINSFLFYADMVKKSFKEGS